MIQPGRIAAWVDRKLIVADRPVGEVIDALRPWYGGVILVADSRLEVQRVTGVYDLADPTSAAMALAQAHEAKVHRISPWVMIISSR